MSNSKTKAAPAVQYATIDDYAKRVGLSRGGLYRLIAAGGGPPVVRFGKAIRINLALAEEWERAQS